MYIISYDITSNKIRRRIAKELENYGIRVQYSVFECNLDKARLKEVYTKMVHLMEGVEEGSIRVYELCQNCELKTCVIGTDNRNEKYMRDEGIVL